jgi:hypothetical protein
MLPVVHSPVSSVLLTHLVKIAHAALMRGNGSVGRPASTF